MNFRKSSEGIANSSAFSLLEMLVAMGVLTLMMVFLFNLVAQTIRAWETGSKQVEAAQAARIGLDTMAQDLQFALGGSRVAPPLQVGGVSKTNIVPFFSTNNAQSQLGLTANNILMARSSGQIFAVAPLAAAAGELYELGYFSAYVLTSGSEEGFHDMRGRRYVLMRHAIPSTNNSASTGTPRADFFYTGTLPPPAAAQWLIEPSTRSVQDGYRTSLIPNCYQLTFRYASNIGGVLSFGPTWTAGDRLPAGVLVSAKVMDEKTAARIAQLRPNGLTEADLANGSTTDAALVLRQGTADVHRFVPFVNSRP